MTVLRLIAELALVAGLALGCPRLASTVVRLGAAGPAHVARNFSAQAMVTAPP